MPYKLTTKKHKRHKKEFVPFLLVCDLTTDAEERLTVFNRLPVLHVNLNNLTSRFRLNLIHEFHGFNDADDRFRLDVAANLHKRIRSRRGGSIERADNW